MTDNPLSYRENSQLYREWDISDEAYREVVLANGLRHRIIAPKTLVIRIGGSTHRVVDAEGAVHCYPAPETGNAVVTWKAHAGKPPIKF